jgi:hypothetical protein
MKLRSLLWLLTGLLLVVPAGTVCPRVLEGFSLPPGTSVISVAGGSFRVTTDATITVEIAFVGTAAVEGSIQASNLPLAHVTIVWQETSLEIYAGTVHPSTTFRYQIPPEFQASVDIGHTEK